MNKAKISTILLTGVVISLLILYLNKPKEKIVTKYEYVPYEVYKTPPVEPKKSQEIFDMINEYRKDHNLKPLKTSYALCRYATLRAYETDNYWNDDDPHFIFKKDYSKSYWLNYRFKSMYENLGWVEGDSTAYDFFYGWTHSKPHEATILRPELRYSCVVCVNETCAQEFSTEK